MPVHRYLTAGEFYPRAEAYLLEHEAENNVILGICTTHMANPEIIREQPCFVIVENDIGQIFCAAVWTPPFNITIAHPCDHAALPTLIDDVRAFRADLPGVNSVRLTSRAFAELWHTTTSVPFHHGLSMGLYQLDSVIPVSDVPGHMRPAIETDRDVLSQWLLGFHADALPDNPPPDVDRLITIYLDPAMSHLRGYVIWDVNGEPVSMAGYTGPTPNGIRVNSVYTPHEHRRKGYASALVAALSQQLLDAGRRFCFLYTDLKNPTSNKIYQQIGYQPICDVDEYRFG